MNRKLEIGFFSDTYRPQVNGVVTSIDLFKEELEKQGHKVYIFCPSIGQAQVDDKVVRFQSFKFAFQPEYHISLPFTRHLLKDFWSKKLDIVHAHTPFSIGLIGYYYAYIKDVPFIYTYHTLYPEYIKSYILKGKIITPRMVSKMVAAFSNHCDLNIAPSDKIKNNLLGLGVDKPIEVLPTGIKVEYYQHKVINNNFRQLYKIADQDKVLLYVGRIGKEKNLDFLLNSLALIKQQIPNVKLVIIGDGPYKKELENNIRQLNLKKEVIFTGYRDKEQVRLAYQAANLFVFASKTDTQGLVLLEAAASSLPMVAVRDEAFAQILKDGDNGFVVSEVKKIFATKVIALLRDRDLYQKMAKQSFLIAQNFSISQQTEKLLKIYNNLVEKK